MTQNQIAYWNLQEAKRANLAREEETTRANVAREDETFRHNVATETVNEGQLQLGKDELEHRKFIEGNRLSLDIDKEERQAENEMEKLRLQQEELAHTKSLENQSNVRGWIDTASGLAGSVIGSIIGALI